MRNVYCGVKGAVANFPADCLRLRGTSRSPYSSCRFGKPGVVLIQVFYATYCVDGKARYNPSFTINLSTTRGPDCRACWARALPEIGSAQGTSARPFGDGVGRVARSLVVFLRLTFYLHFIFWDLGQHPTWSAIESSCSTSIGKRSHIKSQQQGRESQPTVSIDSVKHPTS